MIDKIFTNLKAILYIFLFLASPYLLAQDGILDPSFGNNGIVKTDYNNLYESFTGMTVQNDGKIIVVGHSEVGTTASREAIVIRYNENGSLDTTFGINGIATTPPVYDQLNVVKVQSDGKIVAAGFTNNQDFLIIRYTSNGQLDPSFGTNGIVITDFYKDIVGSSQDRINCIAIQNDGKILVGGIAKYFSNYPYGIARYNTDGTLDNTFGLGGKTLLNHNFLLATGYKEIYDMVVTPSGKIYAVGETGDSSASSYNDQTIVRFNSDGSIDQTFGINGARSFNRNVKSSFKAIKIQNDGKMVLIGNASVSLNVTRLTETGVLDTTFSSDGRDTPPIGASASFGASVLIQPDGKIIISGDMFGTLNYYQPVVVRYLPNGTRDITFGSDGIAKILVSNSFQDGGYSVFQPNGKLVVGGAFSNDSTTKMDMYLFRLTTGTLLSTKDLPNSKFISYPNPAEHFITIRNSQNESFVYQIFDLSGKLIKTGKSKTNEKIDIQNLKKGNYILQLESENGQKQTLKLIKI